MPPGSPRARSCWPRVGGELATPRLVARFGYRFALVAGLVLLGAPAFALSASGSPLWIAAVCVLRGLGFAFTIVAGGALSASLIPAERRGAAWRSSAS
ncbi:hypothetical protein STANM309S_04560 [Streptomyces tanashiensis]